MALNFYLHQGGDRNNVLSVISTLVNNTEDYTVVDYVPETPLRPPQEDEVLHILHLWSDSQEGILYCYVELFSVFGYVVVLTNNYNGDDIAQTYCYNVMARATCNINIELKISKDELILLKQHKLADLVPRILNRNKHIDVLADRIYTEIYRRHVMNNAAKKVIEAHYPQIDWSIENKLTITPAMIDEMKQEIEIKRLAFIARREARAKNKD